MKACFSGNTSQLCAWQSNKNKKQEKKRLWSMYTLSVLVIFCADLVCICCYGVVPVSSSLHFSVLLCFRHAHTITVLVLFSAVLVYVALVEESVPDRDYNAKRWGLEPWCLWHLLDPSRPSPSSLTETLSGLVQVNLKSLLFPQIIDLPCFPFHAAVFICLKSLFAARCV